MYVQRGVIESDVLLDLAARLRYYEEARCMELTHLGGVFVAKDASDGWIHGFADVGLALYDSVQMSFSLPKRPDGEGTAFDSSRCELRPYLSNLAVDSTQQRAGVGRMLVEACESEARSWAGAPESVWLEVSMANVGATEFYRKLGYEQEGVTIGREIVKQRWSLEPQQVSRRLMRKSLREGGGERLEEQAEQMASGLVVPTGAARVAPAAAVRRH